MATLSAGNLVSLRTTQHTARVYLSILQPATLLSAQVNNAAITRGARSIAYDTGSGTFSAVEEGQTLWAGTSAGARDVGRVRIKSISGSATSGTITVDENTIPWADNLFLTVKHNYEIWPVPPRFVSGVFYKFYDLAYSDQNSLPLPVAIAGPDRAGFLSAGSLVFNLNAAASYAVAQGASISSYAWSCTGGTIAAPTSATTTITFTVAGQYWLKLTVTDSNGKSQATYRAIFVHDTANMPYIDFTVSGLTGDWQSGGWRFSLSATGDLDLSEFPDGTAVVLWYENYFDGVAGYINLWGATTGENIICAGYLRNDNDTDDFGKGTGQAAFEVATPQALLDAVTEFGTISIEAKTTPAAWYEYAAWLTVGRAVHHELKWHSTMLARHDCFGLLDSTLGMKVAEMTEPSTLQRVNGLAWQHGVFAKLVSDRLGRLHLVEDIQMFNILSRAAEDTVFTITDADVSGPVNIVHQQEEKLAQAELNGFSFDGTNGTPFVAVAPGYTDTNTILFAEPRGVGTNSQGGQVLATQGDANIKVGRLMAIANNLLAEVRLGFRGNYLGAFDIVPSAGWYIFGLIDADLKRGLALNGRRMLCRNVSHQVGTNGVIQTQQVVFEAEAFGPDGLPGEQPTAQPEDFTDPPPDAPNWDQGEATDESDPDTPTTPLTLVAGSYNDVVQLSDTRAIVAYTASAGTKATIALLDLTTNPVTVLNSISLPGVNQEETYLAVAKFDENNIIIGHALLNTSGPSNAAQARIIYRIGDTLSFGTAATIAAVAITDVGIAAPSSTKAVMTYIDQADGNKCKGVVLNIDLGAHSITANAVQTINANVCSNTDCCAVDSSSVVVVYKRNSAGNLVGNVLDNITTTWTLGSETNLEATDVPVWDNIGQHYLVAVDANRCAAVYQAKDAVALKHIIKAVACSVVNATLTPGTPLDLTDAMGGTGYDESAAATLRITNSIAYIYGSLTTPNEELRRGAVTMAGTGVSGSATAQVAAVNNGPYKAISGAKKVVSYRDMDDGNKIKVICYP